MFDSVIFPCPTEGCDGRIEVQSKAGECLLTDYSPDDVPVVIAADIAGYYAWCQKCDHTFTVGKSFSDRVSVRLVGTTPETCKHCGK